VHVGGSIQSWECVGAGSRGAGLDTVDEEMVQPLDRVQVESSKDACCVKSCF
jgi:hypothetical protein